MQRARTRSIPARLAILILVSTFGFVGLAALASLQVKDTLLSERRATLRAMVHEAMSIAAYYEAREKAGELTHEAAQKLAYDAMNAQRYPNGGYLWMYTADGVCRMHPVKPERVGKNLLADRDAKGNLFIKALLDEGAKDKPGFVRYWFPRPTETTPSPKEGYMETYRPWGWVIGTGLYVDDVDEAFYEQLSHMMVYRVLPLLAVVLAFGIVIWRSVARTQNQLHQATEEAQRLAFVLSREKKLLAGVISAIPQMVFWKDDEGRYVGCNDAYLAFRGLDGEDHLLGRDETSLGCGDALAQALHELEPQVGASGQAVVDHKVDLVDSHGKGRAMLLSVLPLAQGMHGTCGVIGVGADITHVREMERQLAQANRLESIGQLAAGIAHEINTPIQYVTDNTQFLASATADLLGAVRQITALVDPPDDSANTGGADPAVRRQPPGASQEQIRSLLETVELDYLAAEIPGAFTECREGLTRVAEIVRAMKSFAHPGAGRADIDVNSAIESTVQVCRNEWKYVAELTLDLSPDAGHAPCFEGELKQVILNLIVNAAQAIAEERERQRRSTLGAITITTRRDKEYLRITIADDGPGMDETTRRRAFDPFFTTKEVGKGTGQGLSLVHSVIVTKHQGHIDLDTTPGGGATFTLRLPLRAPADLNQQ